MATNRGKPCKNPAITDVEPKPPERGCCADRSGRYISVDEGERQTKRRKGEMKGDADARKQVPSAASIQRTNGRGHDNTQD